MPYVTPLAGVWIEIPTWVHPLEHLPSLPLRECGLKLQCFNGLAAGDRVTPLAGVWIEILGVILTQGNIASLPLRECGLKFLSDLAPVLTGWSLPLRECGLKSAFAVYAPQSA